MRVASRSLRSLIATCADTPWARMKPNAPITWTSTSQGNQFIRILRFVSCDGWVRRRSSPDLPRPPGRRSRVRRQRRGA